DLGPTNAYRSIADMVADPEIDALWLCGRNDARIENMEEITEAVVRGKGALKGIASEKPLARNLAEAQRVVDLVKQAGVAHGYLENQAFAPAVTQGRAIVWARGAALTGRPYLARAAEEHSGPHMPWSFVGAGLRLSSELLGPEYSMSWNTLDSPLKLFFSREVKGKAGEDLVEKQNAEIGLMPVVAGEAAAYGYEAEDRHFVRVFLGCEQPELTFDDGVEVVKLLMTAYMSAEQGKTLEFPPKGLETFVPAVAKGTWKP